MYISTVNLKVRLRKKYNHNVEHTNSNKITEVKHNLGLYNCMGNHLNLRALENVGPQIFFCICRV